MLNKLDSAIKWLGGWAHYWADYAQADHPLVMECRADPALAQVAERVRQAEAILAEANSFLEARGYRHRFAVEPSVMDAPPTRAPEPQALTVKQVLDYLDTLPTDAQISHTFKAPWRSDARYDGEGDPGCEGVHFELLPGPIPATEFAARLRCATLRDHDEIARVLGFSDPEGIGGCSESERVYTQKPSESSRRDYDNHPLTFAALDALVVR